MTREKYQKALFYINTLLVFSAGLYILVADKEQIAKMWETKMPENMFWVQSMGVTMLVVGVIYFLSGRDVKRNRDLIIVGATFKLSFFTLLLISWIIGLVGFGLLKTGFIDLFTGILYVEVLLRNHRIERMGYNEHK